MAALLGYILLQAFLPLYFEFVEDDFGEGIFLRSIILDYVIVKVFNSHYFVSNLRSTSCHLIVFYLCQDCDIWHSLVNGNFIT